MYKINYPSCSSLIQLHHTVRVCDSNGVCKDVMSWCIVWVIWCFNCSSYMLYDVFMPLSSRGISAKYYCNMSISIPEPSLASSLSNLYLELELPCSASVESVPSLQLLSKSAISCSFPFIPSASPAFWYSTRLVQHCCLGFVRALTTSPLSNDFHQSWLLLLL